jgi:Fibrinogen beta and gamma chains, C-terminal globular domain
VVSLYSFYPFRRVDDSLEFYNNTWQQYKVGFNNGIDNGNLWLGNDRIHVMSQLNVTLRIEINGDRTPNSPNPNIYLYGTYNFSVNTIST